MTSSKKRWTTWVVLCLVFIMVAACSNKSANNSGSGNSSSTPAATATPAAGSAESESAPENFNATGYPIVHTPLKLKMMGSRAPQQTNWEEMSLFITMKELTGIDFEFETPPSQQYLERLNLTFATNALPDVLFGARISVENEIRWGEQGLLIPLDPLIEQYAPNIKAALDDNPIVKKSITAPDGHIYTPPLIESKNTNNAFIRMFINHHWLTEAGLAMPTTTDEYIEALRAFKQKDPGRIPLTGMESRTAIMSWFGFVTSQSNDTNFAKSLIDVVDGVVRFTALEPNYLEYLTFMRTLYDEGLLDPETFSQTTQQKNAKGNAGLLGSFLSAAPYQIVGNDYNNHYDMLPPLTSSVNDEKIVPKASSFAKGAFAITNKNPHPEATIRWVDYLYTYEGSVLGDMGIENLDWVYTNDGQTIDQIIRPGAEGKSPAERRGLATPNAGTPIPRIETDKQLAHFVDGVMLRGEEDIHYRYLNQLEALKPFARDVYPNLMFTLDEQKELNVINADLLSYAEQMEARFINGSEPLVRYYEFKSTLQNLKAERFLEIYQTAYDRWNQ